MPVALVLLYNAAIVFGTGYVVFGLGHSGWWFLAAFCFLMGTGDAARRR